MPVLLVDPKGRIVRNALEEAIYIVLKGPTKASHALDCSSTNVQDLVKKEFIRSRDTAVAIDEATVRAGRRVPAAEIMALVPWEGPTRHPDKLASPEEIAAYEVAARRQAMKDAARPTVQARKPRARKGSKWDTSPSSRCLTLPRGGRGTRKRCHLSLVTGRATGRVAVAPRWCPRSEASTRPNWSGVALRA